MTKIEYKKGYLFEHGIRTADAISLSGYGQGTSIGAPKEVRDLLSYPYTIQQMKSGKNLYVIPEKHLCDEECKKHTLDFFRQADENGCKKVILNCAREIEQTSQNWRWRERDDRRVRFVVGVVKELLEDTTSCCVEEVVFISADDSFVRVFGEEERIC